MFEMAVEHRRYKIFCFVSMPLSRRILYELLYSGPNPFSFCRTMVRELAYALLKILLVVFPVLTD